MKYINERVAAALKSAGEQAMRNSNMGQIESYRINHVISLVEREVAAEREGCAKIAEACGSSSDHDAEMTARYIAHKIRDQGYAER